MVCHDDESLATLGNVLFAFHLDGDAEQLERDVRKEELAYIRDFFLVPADVPLVDDVGDAED